MSRNERPMRWLPTGGSDPYLAGIVRALRRNRATLTDYYPRVVFPHAIFFRSAPLSPIYLRIATILEAWRRVPLLRGRCPACNAHAVGLRASGLFTIDIGLVVGVCPRCAMVVMRHTGGSDELIGGIFRPLQNTRFEGMEWWTCTPPQGNRALLAVLAELGEANLVARF